MPRIGQRHLTAENTRGWTILEQLGQDMRYAVRTMAANRLFTLLAVLSLALGIGANTAIFSFMDAILLRSLPVADPESLVVLNWHAKATERNFVMKSMSGSTWGDSKTGTTAGIFPYPAVELFTKQNSVFSSVFAHCQAWQVNRLNLAINGQADLTSGWSVGGRLLPRTRCSSSTGRLIAPDDDRAGAPPVAVISYGLSQRRFGEAASQLASRL